MARAPCRSSSGLLLLIGTSLISQAFELTTVEWILDNFLSSAVLIIIVLFQSDIRRALARVGRGVFPSVARQEETQLAEEVARAAQALAQKRLGALFVLERETHLSDLIEAGTEIDAAVKRDLLISIFLPQSPLHDGAVVIQGGRIAQAGCILPLTLARGSSGRRRHAPSRGRRHHGGERRRGGRGVRGDAGALDRGRWRDGARISTARGCGKCCATCSPAATANAA